MIDYGKSIANVQGAVSIRKTVLPGMAIPMLKIRRPVSIRKTVLPGMAIPMLKIRRPLGRLIFNMGIAIPGKTVFLRDRNKDLHLHWLFPASGSSHQESQKSGRISLTQRCQRLQLNYQGPNQGLFCKTMSGNIYLHVQHENKMKERNLFSFRNISNTILSYFVPTNIPSDL